MAGRCARVAISPDGAMALSGSFDSSAIRWSLTAQRRRAGAALPRQRRERGRDPARTAGSPPAARTDASRSGMPGPSGPRPVLEGHRAPVVALAVSPDGATLASASWDQHRSAVAARRRRAARARRPHAERQRRGVHAATAARWSAPATTRPSRIWPLARRRLARHHHAADAAQRRGGCARRRDRHRRRRRQGVLPLADRRDAGRPPRRATTPIIAVALSADGTLVAAAGIRGSVAIIERASRQARAQPGRARPAGVVARLRAGRPHAPHRRHRPHGAALERRDRRASRRGRAGGPEDPLAAYAGDPGAEVFRACVACHTLNADDGNRAGPTLHGIFGRKIATLPGYQLLRGADQARHRVDARDGGEAVRGRPCRYTPGTKMPEQTIGSPEDRAALVRFLEKVTK